MSTCTVVIDAGGGRCGAPAITSFVSRRTGERLYECAVHAPPTLAAQAAEVSAALPHPPTRTTRPYVLVRDGAIVGYADSASPAVCKRAARLGARIVAVVR